VQVGIIVTYAGVAEWQTCLPAGRRATMYFVYVLKSIKTREFYKGFTDNIERRLEQHFSGKSASTKYRLPLKLIHVELCENRVKARELEKFFKSGFGREILKELDA